MATAQIGTLNKYNSAAESIIAYLERADLYFAANALPNDRQVPTFLSVVGPSVYSTLQDLFAPNPLKDQSLQDIYKKLKEHFEPTRTTIVEQYHFHKRNQTNGESISEYEAALRKLATHCEFEAYLEQALRDRFVCGIWNEAIRRRLLAEKELTLTKAVEYALSMEAAEKNARSVNTQDQSIKKLNFRPRQRMPLQPTNSSTQCSRCGKSNHTPADCKFREATCHSCGKEGHIAPACRSKPKNAKVQPMKPQQTNLLQEDKKVHHVLEEFYSLNKLTNQASEPIKVSLEIEGQTLTMEVDTGAAVSVMSEVTRQRFFPSLRLKKYSLVLKTYTDETLKVMGELNVKVCYNDQCNRLPLIIVQGKGPNLLGRNWLQYLKLDWKRIATVRTVVPSLKSLLTEHKKLFNSELGTIIPHMATLHVQPDAAPKFFKPRPMPFALKDAAGQELDRLESQGVIKRVDSSEWAAPIVIVPKAEGKIRLCGDYKVTINPVLTVDPLPKPDDLFATLANGRQFTKLDLSQAYLQLQLKESSQKYVTINTHQGLYQYTRLPFGIASTPAIFQRLMDTVLQGVPGVVCYIDDILVTGKSEEDHLINLKEVFQRLEKHGFRLKQDKCEFMGNLVEYLGHQIDQEGIHALPQKVSAIVHAPSPTNVQELRSFLGLLNYYGKFIRNLSSLLHPLNELLQANKKWEWTKRSEAAFKEAKQQLISAKVLTHYNPELPLRMAADTSAYGIGAVISHVMPDGSEKPISFAPRTLSTSEQNYFQLKKEALSLTFGVKKFHQYLYGRKFTLLTDHKPLTAIFGSKKGIPTLAAARLQRWALLLSAYQYEIQYKPTNAHANADSLSRLPLPVIESDRGGEGVRIFNISQICSIPITSKNVQEATKKDPILSKVLRYTQEGWPNQITEDLKSFHSKKEEITVESDCLLWGIRVIILKTLQMHILKTLHERHPGIQRMKAMARSYMWWYGIDQDIENQAKTCQSCQQNKANPSPAPLHVWQWSTAPLKRIHIDFAGPFQGKMFLIIVDAHSKWPEIAIMSSTTSQLTIEILSTYFGRYGLPEQVVSDNGPQFTSREFEDFMQQHGIRHIQSAAYHPATNGLAKRFVQTFKNAMKASASDRQSMLIKLNTFLSKYRMTPHATTGVTPTELFLRRKVRTKLDLLKPRIIEKVDHSQQLQKRHHDKHSKWRTFKEGQNMLARDYLSSKKWVNGVVSKILGPTMYQVKLNNGCKGCVTRHIDQLRSRHCEVPSTLLQEDPFKFFTSSGPEETVIEPTMTSQQRPSLSPQ